MNGWAAKVLSSASSWATKRAPRVAAASPRPSSSKLPPARIKLSKPSTTKKQPPAPIKPSARPSTKKQPTTQKQPPVTSLCNLSPALAKVLKVRKTTWPNVVKLTWDYIKAHKLQNATKKTEIVCDEKLKAVFNRKKLTTLEVMKCLSPHVTKQ